MTKTKIIIVGIGGVGGYFGGMLAKKFYNNEKVEVDFVVRGEHFKAIQNKGLKITITGRGRVISQSLPAGATFKKRQAITLFLN